MLLNILNYAIGEIVPVVIGILIVLQINTWNENRKLQIEKHNQNQNLTIEKQKVNSQFISDKANTYTNKFKIKGGKGDNYLNKLSSQIENERDFVVLFTEMIGINSLVIDFHITDSQNI